MTTIRFRTDDEICIWSPAPGVIAIGAPGNEMLRVDLAAGTVSSASDVTIAGVLDSDIDLGVLEDPSV